MKPRIFTVARKHLRKDKWVDVVHESHIELILKYGGVPVMVPRVPGAETILGDLGPLDGLLLVEGEDISPSRYKGPDLSPERRQDPDPSKDEVEFRLMDMALAQGAAILGICRGMQVLNVARGGTLWQDVMQGLGTTLPHIDLDNYDGYRHPLKIEPGSRLSRWYGSNQISVNSYHHQGIKALGKGLEAMAWSPDGLIEGIQDSKHSFQVGLQFHPERMLGDHPGCEAVFRDFLGAAKQGT